MSRFSLLFGGLLLLIIVSGCGRPTIHVDSHYLQPNSKILDASISIVVVDEPKVNYDGSVEDEFGKGPMNQRIVEYFYKELPMDIENTGKVKKVGFDTLNADIEWKEVVTNATYTQTEYFNVPVAGSEVVLKNRSSDCALFIFGLSIGTYYVTNPGYGSTKKLYYKSDFTLWDIKNKREVAFGSVSVATPSRSFFGFITMECWNEVSRQYAEELFRDLPLEKRY